LVGSINRSAFPDTYPFGGVQVELNECFALLATANARVAPVLSKQADFAAAGIECGVSNMP
jgi:hypothetical protein